MTPFLYIIYAWFCSSESLLKFPFLKRNILVFPKLQVIIAFSYIPTAATDAKRSLLVNSVAFDVTDSLALFINSSMYEYKTSADSSYSALILSLPTFA